MYTKKTLHKVKLWRERYQSPSISQTYNVYLFFVVVLFCFVFFALFLFVFLFVCFFTVSKPLGYLYLLQQPPMITLAMIRREEIRVMAPM